MTVFLQSLFANAYVLALFSAICALLLSIRMYPVIIYVAHKKGLMDEPGERSMHHKKVPTLGGVGLFIAFSLSLILFGLAVEIPKTDLNLLLSILGATIMLLFLGIKDDLIALSPLKKFSGQLVAAAIIIFLTDLRISSFDGLMGIGVLPYWVSVMFSIFVFILVINAFNLIDGIDGLAGGIAILASISFGIFFMLNGNLIMTLVSFILVGALVGFLRHNLSNTRKLFLGDSGSMFTGFLLAYQGISFLEFNHGPNAALTLSNAPILLLAILSYPLLDTLRVFIIRVRQGRSPFSADCNHIHHRLLHLGLRHKQATLLICMSNGLLIGLALLIGDLNINLQFFIFVGIGTAIYLFPAMFVGYGYFPNYGPAAMGSTVVQILQGAKGYDAPTPDYKFMGTKASKAQQFAFEQKLESSKMSNGTKTKGKQKARYDIKYMEHNN